MIKKEILVVGGAGFIGSHTVVKLLNSGYRVTVLDNFSNSSRDVIDRLQYISGKIIRVVSGDIRDRFALAKLFQSAEFGCVINFAGLKSVNESLAEPLRYYDNNVAGSLVLLEVMSDHNVKKIVFSSSATVYGFPKVNPISELAPLAPLNPYGRSKLAVENILSDLYQSDPSWSIACLRYFNPVGAHKSGLIGEEPNGTPANLMPFIAQVAAGKLNQLLVFGSDYPTNDGTGVRDYIHVEDLAEGHLAALHALENPGLIKVNLGTGQGYSVLELIKTFQAVTGTKIPYKIVGRRPGDVAVCYADPSEAKRLLGWEASLDIERMCADTWRWQCLKPCGFSV